MSRILVYSAVSLDGFLAGEDDDLSWLPHDSDAVPDPDVVEFDAFLEGCGSMLMGRNTHDVVRGMGGDWPYGELPVLVATHRPLESVPTVSTCTGDIDSLCRQAKELAGDKDVYLDGGNLITQALDAGCVDRLVLSVVPILLGRGAAIYTGTQRPGFHLQVLGRYGEMVQLSLEPRRETQ